jgi:hypothetical protein
MPGVCTSVVALLGCAGDLSLTDRPRHERREILRR